MSLTSRDRTAVHQRNVQAEEAHMLHALQTSSISLMPVPSFCAEGIRDRVSDRWLPGQRNIECPKGFYPATGSCVEEIA